MRILALVFPLALHAQSLTLSAPATVLSGQPVTITVSYAASGATYDDVTWALAPSLPAGVTVDWTSTAVLTPGPAGLLIADGVVGTAVVTLPDGVWSIHFDSPTGQAADGTSGPVSSNTITVTVGNPLVAPSGLSAAII